MSWWVAVVLDGVTYTYGHRQELTHLEPVPVGPSREVAGQVVDALLSALTGDDQRLRAGWASVRWQEELEGGAAAWRGPAYLFAFEAREAGAFEVSFTGEDEAEWPPPQ